MKQKAEKLGNLKWSVCIDMGYDEKTMELIRQVSAKKSAIAKAEKSSYRTNMSFAYGFSDNEKLINLQACNDNNVLLKIAGFLISASDNFYKAQAKLFVEGGEFSHQGFSLDDWLHDIKTRIGKIQIAGERKKLEALEARLNAIVSPELRAQMEIEAIQKELGL